MYTRAKYLVGEIRSSHGQEQCAVVFSELITHSDVARVFVPGTVVSGGFCHYTDEGVKVYGESISARVKCNPAVDEELVGRAMAHPKYALM
jgi:hypothetical protein